MMAEWKLSALRGTQQLNPGLELSGGRVALVDKHGDMQHAITNSTRSVRLFWKLTTVGGEQCGHVRFCSPRTVQQPSSLWCVFCSYDPDAWRQQHKAVVPVAEYEFIVNFLRPNRIDTQYCHQVTTAFWPAPLDFWNYSLDFFVQIDGLCHWCGMHGVSKEQVQARDFERNLASFHAGARLVRVHYADLHNSMALLAALNAVVMGYSIVLSPSYSTTLVMRDGVCMTYVAAAAVTFRMHALLWIVSATH